ncbi:enoyl-CoA hydratase [bacterium SM23_31]|nr:MAG: enoyl-CoA hydratase [bacterium SM23_31]
MKYTEGVTVDIEKGTGTISFYHPKSNSLPGALIRNITEEITGIGGNDDARVVVLRSGGDGAFCAGASFDELASIDNFERGKDFFMEFGRLILAMRKCPKFIITRVQGKSVGGGIGIIAASDYAFALNTAYIKLSELSLSIGPFVIGPAVKRKIGFSAFNELAIGTEWRDAQWAQQRGLYAEVYDSIEELDKMLSAFAEKLSKYSPEAMAELKTFLWEGTEYWSELLPPLAAISGRLVLSDHTQSAIADFKRK